MISINLKTNFINKESELGKGIKDLFFIYNIKVYLKLKFKNVSCFRSRIVFGKQKAFFSKIYYMLQRKSQVCFRKYEYLKNMKNITKKNFDIITI